MRDHDEGPVDPMPGDNDFRTAAIAMHEMFTSYRAAGFNRSEALYLVAQSVRPRAPEGPDS